MKLIIATRNKGKIREIKRILRGIEIDITYLLELDKSVRIKEDGKTFFENALKKAIAVSRRYKNDLVVGEDSGLEVPILNSRPGIFSKRYSGKNATYHKNNLKLLAELKNVPYLKRKAHFKCIVAVVKNKKLLKKVEGKLVGLIHDRIAGKGGFGYDPVFYLPAYRKTVAQISLRKKNQISHRAKAFLKLKNYLTKYLENK